ncbi:MAG: Peptidylprolyl isomerase [Ignavibacteria bacterium]|nr:Peptidylprolyl isomerase [Ignavibacteria bacterium]
MFRAAQLLTITIIALLTISNSYSADKKQGEKEAAASIGKEKIMFSDVEKAFRKNMNKPKAVRLNEVSRDSAMDFINLYIKYRLKVIDALDRGFDKDSAVLADIVQNRKILAESYYYDKKLIEPNIERLLAMRNWEMQISLILFLFENKTATSDTADAYRKGMAVFDSLKNGAKFGDLAFNLSDDPETKKNHGLIPTFLTAGKVQKQIESAIYSIKKEGDIYPELIKTKFGYFIIKLEKKIPRILVSGRHILISTKADVDSAAAKRKADSILKLVKSGSDFSRIAEENSDDPSSAMKGGSLGNFYSRSSGFENTGKSVVPEFENTLFSLKDGETSGLIKTDYGYHIIRRDSTKNFDVQAEREDLRRMYKRLFFEDDKKALMDSMKKAAGFSIYNSAMNNLLASIDTTKTTLEAEWFAKIPETVSKENLYTINNKNTSVSEFTNLTKTRTDLRGLGLNSTGFRTAIEKIIEPMAFETATKNLEKEYPDFEILMKEFKDGILLFRVEALEVWDKLKFDSTLARKFHDTTKQRYSTEPKYNITEIYVLTDSLANELHKRAMAGENFDTLAAHNTQRKDYREKAGSWGFVAAKNNKLAEFAAKLKMKSGDISEPQSYEKGFSIIKVNAFEPVRQKTFEEAISDFAPEFQDMVQKNLTESWLKRIKEKFPVTVYDENIDEFISKKSAPATEEKKPEEKKSKKKKK